MWIKKITSRLYLYVICSVVISAILSMSLCYIGMKSLAKEQLEKYEEYEEYQKHAFDNIVSDIEKYINSKGVTSKEFAKELIVEDYDLENKYSKLDKEDYDIYIITSFGKIINTKEGVEMFNENSFDKTYIYPIKFSDGDGFIVINPIGMESIPDIYENGIVFISIGLFIILTMITIKNQ